jgi:hypothetical protein
MVRSLLPRHRVAWEGRGEETLWVRQSLTAQQTRGSS